MTRADDYPSMMARKLHPNRVVQQETAQRHVSKFLRLLGIAAEPQFDDRPDAIIEYGGKRIGIEPRELTERRLAANRPGLGLLADELRRELARRGMGPTVAVGIGV